MEWKCNERSTPPLLPPALAHTHTLLCLKKQTFIISHRENTVKKDEKKLQQVEKWILLNKKLKYELLIWVLTNQKKIEN